MKRYCKTSKNPKGFTLIELIVVIAIIAILSTIVAISVSAVIRSSRKKAAAASLENYWRITSIYINQVNNGFTSTNVLSDKQLKTRFPSDVLHGLKTSVCPKSLPENKIWIQYADDPTNAHQRYSIVKITIRMGNKWFYTMNGFSSHGPYDPA